MADFKYAAKSPGGSTVEGTITAETKAAAVAELRKKNLVIIKLDEGGRAKLPVRQGHLAGSSSKAGPGKQAARQEAGES